ncbi:winged helix-turn-helix domain-containing protein [Enterovibrio baiacu]|uniref:winged helix-turn-helix domain-containing protein n=1 Tax=Enterovibrio baiacu TaxID=2491023 RepID=UPI0010132983|nr:winged helix-turn-helix domain-containing protein [Enterovibrio baiacu]MBE1274314.1 hypothetical protein [Enterovibrio baiacu]
MKQLDSLILGKFRWERNTHALVPLSDSANSDGTSSGIKRLTRKQQDLLCCLTDAYPNAASKQDIVMNVWGNEFISAESLPQLINRTRAALNDKNKSIIVNIPGVGYALTASKAENLRSISSSETAEAIEVEKTEEDVNTPAVEVQESHEPLAETTSPAWWLENAHKLRLTAITALLCFTVINILSFYQAYTLKHDYITTRFSVQFSGIEDTANESKKKVTINNLVCFYERESHELDCS